MTEPVTLQMYVDGNHVDARSGERFDVLNPATGEVYASVPKAAVDDVDDAVAAAGRALRGEWRTTAAPDRAAMLGRLVSLLGSKIDEFAAAETAHNGKTLLDSDFDLHGTVGCFEYYAGAATKYGGSTISGPADYLLYTRREPVGVCGLIVPWNFPIAIAAWKIAPALAAGCTVIVKPSSETPVTVLMLADLVEEAGFPPGVFNVITGPGSVVGNHLVTHAGVDKISITGETATGKTIMRNAADTLKRVTLELGGKSPNLVFADADIEQAVDGSLVLAYANSGQVCDARSRIFVQDAQYEEFCARFVEKAGKIRVGDPTDANNHCGAITSARQLEKIEYYVEIGQKEGATLACGGHRVGEGRGLFYAPTAFVDVDNSMRIAQEEIFGPVACIGRFSDYDDGIAKANDTPYGLAATVWTSDITTAHRAAHDIRAGGVWVNTSEFLFNESPFGGMKASGFGRELSIHGMDAYTEIKTVGISLGGHIPTFDL